MRCSKRKIIVAKTMTKTLLFIDSSIKIGHNHNARIEQYKNGFKSVSKHMEFFRSNNIDLLWVDNTISSLDEIGALRECIDLDNVKTIFKKNNKYGKLNKGAGCIEHWILGTDIWRHYDYIIHFEARQVLINVSFFEEFLREPISMFSWAYRKPSAPLGILTKRDRRFRLDLYGPNVPKNTHRQNPNAVRHFNDFYTGLFSVSVPEFIELVNNIRLDGMVKHRVFLEKIMMSFAYCRLDKFKMVDKLYVWRGGDRNDSNSVKQS